MAAGDPVAHARDAGPDVSPNTDADAESELEGGGNRRVMVALALSDVLTTRTVPITDLRPRQGEKHPPVVPERLSRSPDIKKAQACPEPTLRNPQRYSAHDDRRSMYYADEQLYDVSMDAVRAKVTRNGQVSLPAELRHRWASGTVLVIDRGDYAIVRPIPTEPLARLRGAHAGPGPSTEQARAGERAAEAEREQSGSTPR